MKDLMSYSSRILFTKKGGSFDLANPVEYTEYTVFI